MSVLITGGTGFVGLALAETLVGMGRRCCLFALLGLPSSFAGTDELKEIEVFRGDIRSLPDIKAALAASNATDVVHLAAKTPDRQQEWADPSSIIEVNVAGTTNLIRALRDHASLRRVILVSSVAVYGTQEPPGGRFREHETSPDPRSLYGVSKLASEHVACNLAKLYDIDLRIARLGPVFGPWEYGTDVRPLLSPHGQVLDILRHHAEACLPRPMHADWLYSRDAGAALAALLDSERLNHQIYNVGAGDVTSVAEWCGHLSRVIPAFRWRVAERDEMPNIQQTLEDDRAPLDITRLRQDTDCSPSFDLAAAVDDHYLWLAAHDALITA